MEIQDRPAETPETPASPAPASPERKSVEQHGLYRVGLAYGRFIYRLRWLVIVLWVAGLAVSVPFAAKVTSVLTGGGYSYTDSESERASAIIQQKLNTPASTLLVVFQSQNGSARDFNYQAEVNDFMARARTFPNVTDVTQGGISADGRTTYVAVDFSTGESSTEHQLNDFKAIVPTGDAQPARTYVTGNPAVFSTFTQTTQHDTEVAEIRALPLALIVLLVVFGTLVAAITPLLLAFFAVPTALALIYALALHTQTSVFVTNVATIVGLGISIDYSLFMARRFREELAYGRPVRDAVGWTVATAGEAILFSGLTVMIGFIALLLIGIQFMTSFGIGGAVVVACSVTAALTLLPALLSVFGTRINSLRIPLLSRLTMATDEQHRGEHRSFWRVWALGVMRRPVLIIVLVSGLLIALGWPIFSLSVGTPTSSSLPTTSEARQGLDIMSAAFPQTNANPVYIVAQSPDGSSILSPDNLARVDSLSTWLAAQPHVTGVTSITRLPETSGSVSPSLAQLSIIYSSGTYKTDPNLAPIAQLVGQTTNDDTTLITVNNDTKVDSTDGKALIDHLRAGDKQAANGLTVLVGGFQAVSLDFNRYLYDNFPKAIAFILVATFFLLLLMFRSLLLPLKAVLMNVLSVSAAYGVLVFVFQWGHGSEILGFTPNGFLDSTIPILLFCLLFGLSMDYEVFLLSRIREEWLRVRNNRYAVATGLEKTGGVITNAALLFVIVTGAFTFTTIVITQEMGLGMTVAVLVDATIIRSLLVPATMRLLGRWNWWLPGRPIPVERAVE